ncbi:MAG TPA: hypothetical protein VIF11_11295 [Methylomirabilota bacterium]
MRRSAFGLLGIAVLLAMSSGPAAGEPPRFVDYLYINASEGSASGGHVALRFGDEVFHFEHRPPGILVLARAKFERFRHLYGDLENRTIQVSRIQVSDETYDLLFAQFSRHHLVQRQRLEVLDALRGARKLLEALRDQGVVALDGLGLFVDASGTGTDATDRAPALDALRARVASRYGPDFIADRIVELTARLAVLHPEGPSSTGAADDELRPPSYGFSERFRDMSQALAALDVLDTARRLRPDVIRAGSHGLSLKPGEAARLTRLADALEESLVRLMETTRPDWGLPMLLGMARLIALRETVETGQWQFLDAFPVDAEVLPPIRTTRRRTYLTKVREDYRLQLEVARESLLGAPDGNEFPEIDYARLESAVNRWLEVSQGLDEGRPRRAHTGVLLPDRPGLPAARRAPLYDEASLTQAVEVAAREEARIAAALERDYPYNLITRNCVSEIFRELDIALARAAHTDKEAMIREESIRRLGGHVAMLGSLNFVPRISALVVGDTYSVAEQLRLASYRDRRLADMRRDENAMWVFLRESNVVTSTLYRVQPQDSIFLFFTDDLVAPRPLFGAANLLTGLAASAVGLAMWPVDGGETLWAGLRGALFSLPELVFHNIRKGSFDVPVASGRVEESRHGRQDGPE